MLYNACAKSGAAPSTIGDSSTTANSAANNGSASSATGGQPPAAKKSSQSPTRNQNARRSLSPAKVGVCCDTSVLSFLVDILLAFTDCQWYINDS